MWLVELIEERAMCWRGLLWKSLWLGGAHLGGWEGLTVEGSCEWEGLIVSGRAYEWEGLTI